LLNEAGELLLVKRRFEPKANQWALPSGYLEIFHTPEENALEELREETGLEGEILQSLGWFYGSSPIYEKILSIGFRIKATGGILKAGDDALEAMFYPLDQLPPIAFHSHQEYIRRGLEISVD
jgi:8-oxo-dGTP diphosphatase